MINFENIFKELLRFNGNYELSIFFNILDYVFSVWNVAVIEAS